MLKRVPVTIRGVKFASVSEAARALGVCVPTISNARKEGRIDGVGLKKSDGHSVARKPVVVRGIEYPSIDAAARALGVSRTTIVRAKQRGTLNNVGLGKRGRKKRGRIVASLHNQNYSDFES